MTAELSRFDLRVDADVDDPDEFVVTVLVDGVALFELPGENGRVGPYPDEFVLPLHPGTPTRVAVATCMCRNRGCEDLAAVIAGDGKVVTWSDFRTFTGWDDLEEMMADALPEFGAPSELVDLHFDAAQYSAEIRRYAADRTWWTPTYTARMVARALYDAQVRSIERD